MTRTKIVSLFAVVGALSASVAGLSLVNQRSAVADPAPQATTPASGTFEIDPVHSSVVFKIKHMNATNFYGRFDAVSGSFALGDTGSVTAVVKSESVDTNNPKRDQHVRSPDFLSVKEFPEINFTAKNLTKKGASAYEGRGDLTLRGVTKPVDFVLNVTGSGKMMGKDIVGVETTITIKRSSFGSDKMLDMLGDDVTLMISFEGGLK